MLSLNSYLLAVVRFGAAFGYFTKGRPEICWLRAAWRHSSVYGALVATVFTPDALADAPESETPTEANIASVTAGVLDRLQFSPRPLDELLSSQFMDCYLNALDGSHLLFLQSDVD